MIEPPVLAGVILSTFLWGIRFGMGVNTAYKTVLVDSSDPGHSEPWSTYRFDDNSAPASGILVRPRSIDPSSQVGVPTVSVVSGGL